MHLQELARRYHEQSRVVFPVGVSHDIDVLNNTGTIKKALHLDNGWTGFTLEKVREKSFNKNGIGLLAGSRSGVMVVDIDNMELWAHILETLDREEPKTCRARSQRGGLHLFFRDTPELAAIEREQLFGLKKLGFADDVDILGGNKRFVFLPPSSFNTPFGERKYEYVEGFSLLDNPEHLLPAPRWLIKVLTPGSDDYRKVLDSFVAKKKAAELGEEYDLFGDEDGPAGPLRPSKPLGPSKQPLGPSIKRQKTLVWDFTGSDYTAVEQKLTTHFGAESGRWTFTPETAKSTIRICRSSDRCFVEPEHLHSRPNHSCIYVNFNQGPPPSLCSVYLNCFTHGAVNVTEEMFQVFGWEDKRTITQVLTAELVDFARENNLRRLNVDTPGKGTAGKVFAPKDGHRWVYTEQWPTYYKFVNTVIAQHVLATRGKLVDELVNLMVKLDHPEFPEYVVSENHVAFRDGVFDLKTLQFHDMASEEGPGNIVARHFLDVPFPRGDRETLPTPEFDKMVQYQIEEPAVYEVFLALLGRLQYWVGEHDNWQVMPFLKGLANTGKSSVLKIVQKMFNPPAIGSISVNHEQKFGLQGIYDKEVAVVMDVPLNMKDVLKVTLWQSMVSGETVPVPLKGTQSVTVEWKVPMIWAGNVLPNYPAQEGASTRRLVSFDFNNPIVNMDGGLFRRIVQNELGNLFVKTVTKYRRLALEHGDRG
ncbi:hypothetical protein HK102_007024, partial [Quaeritorhiza haematococci]